MQKQFNFILRNGSFEVNFEIRQQLNLQKKKQSWTFL